MTITNRAPHAIDHVNLSILPRAFGYFAFTGQVRAAGAVVPTRWTTGTNLRVSLGRWLGHGQRLSISVPFRLTVGSSGGAFTARTSRDRGVISFGEWFPILSRPHDSYGVGDPQVTRTARPGPAGPDHLDASLALCGRLPGHGPGAGGPRPPLDLRQRRRSVTSASSSTRAST